jgi:rhodanese-related sulfurtransferase
MSRLFALFGLAVLGLTGSSLAVEIVPIGVVFKDEEVALKLTFSNRRKEAVDLANATASCDCLRPWFVPMSVAADETVALPFAYVSHVTGRIDVVVEFRGAGSGSLQTTLVRGFVAERGWLISPEQLHAVNSTEMLTVIDVRDVERFLQAHLSRSSNMLPFALKARTDLRAKKVVLVDDGFAPDSLLEQVRTLRQLGFKDVVALEGGVPAWIRAGFAVEGASKSALSVATISPAEFARSSATTEWRIIEVAGETSRPPMPGTISVRDWTEAVSRLVPSDATGRARLASNVLIIASDSATYARTESQCPTATAASVFYLAGGRPALDAYHATQAALALSTHQITQARSATRSHPATAGGCKTCPK